MDENFGRAERDMLIEVRTELRGVAADVKELKDSLAARVLALEVNKLDKTDAERYRKGLEQIQVDNEQRFRRLERWGFIAIGALTVLEFAFRFIRV